MNPFDEISVEEAVRLKEKGKATEVIAVSIGPQQAQETIRTALAMGADRGILVKAGRRSRTARRRENSQSHLRSRTARPCHPRQAGDRRRFQPDGPDAGRASGLAAGDFAHKLEMGDGTAKVEREIDGGLQTVEIKLPAIVTTDLRLNEPRYASLPNIMKAKKKPIDEKTPADYGVDVTPRLKVLKVTEPPKRQAGIKVKTAAELVDKLKNEAGAI